MSSPFSSIDRRLMGAYLIGSYPIICSNLNVLTIEAINTIMVSRVGVTDAVSAVFAHTLFNIFKKFNTGMAMSISLLVAHTKRKKKHNQIKKIFNHGLLLNTFFALIFSIVLILLSYHLTYISPSPEIATLGSPYLRIISISLIPCAINSIIKRYLEGQANGNIPLLLNFFTLITNLIFNFILIYGQCGFPMFGLNGAAIAIVLSETVTAVAGTLYLLYKPIQNHHIMDLNVSQISWRYFRKIGWLSWPVGLQFAVEGAYLLFIAIIAGSISIEAQATHTILFNISQLMTIFAIGLGQYGSILVTQQHHPKNDYFIRKVGFMACSMIAIISIIVGLMLCTISPYIIGLYKPVDAVKTLVSQLITYLCFFQLFYSMYYWGSSMLRGLHDDAFLFLLNMFTKLLRVGICYSLVIKYNWHLNGIWITLILEHMLISFLLLIRFDYKTKPSV
ncbi:MATE family efflux transporter [Candidatus Cardinium hertigii]|uniref:MATE family efflux transporter n=1 Tax=Candidatus Cardinium hertigii TaxID=247481 RepID=UPI003D7EB1CB